MDKGHESAGLGLQVAQAAEVLDALGDGLDVAEHHRATGLHAELVGGAHDREPLLRVGFAGADFAADAVNEDFAAAAGDGRQAGVLQAQQDIAERQAEGLVEVPDFRRAEGVDVDGGVVLPDEAQQFKVPFERSPVAAGVAFVGQEAALHQDLRAADRQQLIDLAADFRVG